MSNQLNSLKNRWQDAKDGNQSQSVNLNEIISLSKKKMKSSVNMHIKNITILMVTLLGISAFFQYMAPVKETISQIGALLMIGGLILRIFIELYSIYLSSKINMIDSATKNNNSSLQFYQFRKKIHGPVMTIIIIAYTIGFYMLTPEFSLYFSLPMMILIDVSYIVGAVIVAYFIRMGIRNEMNYLNELLELQNDIKEEKTKD